MFICMYTLCFQGYIEAGLFSMVYGEADSLVDFLHVDNFVQAHTKVADKLLPDQPTAVSTTNVHMESHKW